MTIKTQLLTKRFISFGFVCCFTFLNSNFVNAESSVNTQSETGIFKFWKKKKKKDSTEEKKDSKDTKKKDALKAYDKVITKDAVSVKGVIDIHRVGADYFFELKKDLLERDFLVVNKISKVPSEINQTGLNKGMNYQNLMIRFHADTLLKKIWVTTHHPFYEGKEGDAITQSVKDNYNPSIRESFKMMSLNADSTAYVFKVNKVFDGSEKSLNDLFASIGLPGSAVKSLSKIEKVKSFPKNVLVKSLLTTKAEGITVTIEVTSNIVLLDKEPMKPRFADPRVGFFTTKHFYFSDSQHALESRELVSRWRLEPKDEDVDKYLAGELVEPKKPIIYYIDPSTPVIWRQAIKDGIVDWQKAFEQAGFKNAILAKDAPTDDEDFDGDDVRYSLITYVASDQANAMGPSVVDPRSGEILEADVIWWHNVLTMLHSWIRVQTGAIDTKARSNKFSDEHMAHAIRFVSSHEVGHTLGLMHNMGASYAYSVDSLRSKSFTDRMGGTAPSIMDYARFNYVAQPEDGVTTITPQIGTYDKYAIDWAYRWTKNTTPWEDLNATKSWIRKHENNPLYHYGPQQSRSNLIDPSAQSEDLGDNSMKASRLGLKNLERLVPKIQDWTVEDGEFYDKAGKMMMGIIGQWFTYANHVLVNVGGVYLDQPVGGESANAYVHVETNKQKDAVKYIVNKVLTVPTWLTDADIYKKTYPIRGSVVGPLEYSPTTLFRDLHSMFYYSLFSNDRLLRMLQNEAENGAKAYSAAEMLTDIYEGVFAKSIKYQNLDVYTRSSQKNMVDALIISLKKSLAKSSKKKLNGILNAAPKCFLHDHCSYANDNDFMAEETNKDDVSARRVYYSTMTRVSDAISSKRAILFKIRKLLKKRINSGDNSTRYHYQDIILRIEESLNL